MLPTNTEKHKLAQLYAESFRLKTQEHGWFAEKVQDFSAGYDAGFKAQEELLKAAHKVIECVEINTETHFFSINWKIKEAIEKYTTLKQQQ